MFSFIRSERGFTSSDDAELFLTLNGYDRLPITKADKNKSEISYHKGNVSAIISLQVNKKHYKIDFYDVIEDKR